MISAETGEERTAPCTVLLVDDEPQILAGLKNALRKMPFTILTATSGRQALVLLDENEVDVVVSDERMPGMTGTEFLGIVRQRYPHTIRIILTGQASLEAAIRAINEGEVYRFLTKPCNPMDLTITIQRALQLRNLAWESSRLLARTREQKKVLQDLENKYPGISEVKVDANGAILLEGIEGLDDLIRQLEKENR
jgi:two-component system, probable response regulator PhcQ